MYTKLELVMIFTSAKSYEELMELCALFSWLIDEGYEQKSAFLQKLTQLTFRKLSNI